MKKLMSLALMAMAVTAAVAQAPLWLRQASISPDGSEIVFTYKGDIYKVPSAGGRAQQLTTTAGFETAPVWSPDGKYIAFASDRKGGSDVYIMPSAGGTARQLTYHSAAETPTTFTPDGKYVYYIAAIQDPVQSALFPSARLTEVYQVPIDGGRPTRVLASPAEDINFDPQGRFFLYHDRKGGEDPMRKHHTSSITRDVWRYDIASGRHTNLTARAGEDRTPRLAPDGKTVYFLSERNGGSFNVWQMPLDEPSQATAVTTFKTNPVRFLSVAKNGTICFTYDGEIYTQRPGAKPAKVAINLIHDDVEQVKKLTFSKGATGATVSPDGKQVAFVVRGDVFVTSVEYETTKRVSATPQAEADVCWNKDNRTLAYATERNGNWQLVKATIERDDDPNFPNATLIKEEILLPSTTVERAMPQFSPDGEELAFIEDRTKLKVLNLKSGKVRQITDGSTWYETNGGFYYEWSPDGKWFTLEFIGNQRDPYTDIGLVSSQGGGEIFNITASAYFSERPRFVMDGNAILYLSNRYGMRSHASWGSQSDVLLVFLNQAALDKYNLNKEDAELLADAEKKAEKKDGDDKKDGKKDDKKDAKKDEKKDSKKKDIEVELRGIEDRIVRVTPNSSDIASAYITSDGESLYYLSAFEKGYDLWKMDLRKHSTKLLDKTGSKWANIEPSADGKALFLLGSATMQKLTVSSDKLKSISYNAVMKMDLAAEREYMFNHVQQQIDKRFYNLNYHGVNWKQNCDNYRKFLPHINNNYDFAELLSELLGELNVSHTGGHYYPAGSEATGQLALIYDWNYTGKGLKVDEVVTGGPLDKSKSKVKVGTIIEKINGEPITVENDYTLLLNGTVGKKTLLSCYNPKSGERWDEVVKPISNSALNTLLYKRWVARNARMVDSLSGGRLGYVHLKAMNDASYREVYSQVLGKYNKREGIVIDTRWNGGGRLHEDIEVLFSGKKYLTQVIRGRAACDMPSRRWNKPSIMLQCEANYSNAHGTPWVYKHDGIGKLVGAPVPGTMTSVSWEDLQDDSMLFGIPIIGYLTAQGEYLENSQLEPDILILNDPQTVVQGEDRQLKTAVDELLRELK